MFVRVSFTWSPHTCTQSVGNMPLRTRYNRHARRNTTMVSSPLTTEYGNIKSRTVWYTVHCQPTEQTKLAERHAHLRGTNLSAGCRNMPRLSKQSAAAVSWLWSANKSCLKPWLQSGFRHGYRSKQCMYDFPSASFQILPHHSLLSSHFSIVWRHY